MTELTKPPLTEKQVKALEAFGMSLGYSLSRTDTEQIFPQESRIKLAESIMLRLPAIKYDHIIAVNYSQGNPIGIIEAPKYVVLKVDEGEPRATALPDFNPDVGDIISVNEGSASVKCKYLTNLEGGGKQFQVGCGIIVCHVNDVVCIWS